jgi:hypothetical protein
VQVSAVSGIEDLLAIDGQTRAAAQAVVKRMKV